jgi:recombination protein U
MIKYPNMKPVSSNKLGSKTKTFGNRGQSFEDEINDANSYYLNNNRAVIFKKPTPIKVVRMTNDRLNPAKISEAYFVQPSTTDYNGLYRGKYIDFEAKETQNKTLFPLANVHSHQIEHLARVVSHGGIGFILINFRAHQEVFLMDANLVLEYYKKAKSIPYEDFKTRGKEVKVGYVVHVDYLKVVDELYF